jgi:cytochrome c553
MSTKHRIFKCTSGIRLAAAVLFQGLSWLLVIAMPLEAEAQVASSSDDAARKLATQVCSSCHGPGGNSASPTFPRLAAQQEAYLIAQISNFKNGTRGEQAAHDYMLGMTTLIDDATSASLARYYAHQPPTQGQVGDSDRIARGKKLFEQGVEGRVVACATCHGAHAEGAGIFPRLAGQHAEYVERQLKVIQSNLRKSPVMHGIITNLTADDMSDVAVYLESVR